MILKGDTSKADVMKSIKRNYGLCRTILSIVRTEEGEGRRL